MFHRARLTAVAAALLALFVAVSAQAADKKDLALLPGDAEIVMQIDLKSLAGTTLFKDLIKQAKMNPQLQTGLDEVKKTYGVDPEKDIERLTVMFPSKSRSGQALFVINTSVGYDTLLKGATSQVEKRGKKIEEKTAGKVSYHSADKMAMAKVGDRILFGDEALVIKALETKKGKGLDSNKKMMALVNDATKSGGGHLWFAAALPDAVRAQMAQNDPLAKDISAVRGSLDFAAGLAARLDIQANKGAATKMAEQLNTQIAKAKEEQGKQPMAAAMGLGAVLNGIKAEAKGDDVHIALDLTQQQVDQLKAMAMMMIGMAAQQNAAPSSPPKAAPKKK